MKRLWPDATIHDEAEQVALLVGKVVTSYIWISQAVSFVNVFEVMNSPD
jgi:hypothetical protein